MRVSIILPNYNHSKYLNQRIDSILEQTFREFELIILDDKSDDESVAVIESYRGHEQISHIIYNDENSGSTFKQWAKGVALAQGEYIWIAESDDYADSRFLEMCVKGLDENPSAALCFSDSYFVDKRSRISDEYEGLNNLILKKKKSEHNPTNLNRDTKSQTILYEGFEFLRNRMTHANYIYNASMVVFRKSILAEISTDYTRFKGCGDWVFWAEMMVDHDVARVPKRLNYFRQHKNKVSNKNTKCANHIIESAHALYYILELVSHEALRRRMDHSRRHALQRPIILFILMVLREFIKHQPQRRREAKCLKRRMKLKYWGICYAYPFLQKISNLGKRKAKPERYTTKKGI